MKNLKTKEEMYFDYNEAIEFLENEVGKLKREINFKNIEIEHKKDRIVKLKETAEMYAPKQKKEIDMDLEESIPESTCFTKATIANLHAGEEVNIKEAQVKLTKGLTVEELINELQTFDDKKLVYIEDTESGELVGIRRAYDIKSTMEKEYHEQVYLGMLD
jgi:prefoldin subunit 5